MFPWLLGCYSSYLQPKQDSGTSKILVHPTWVSEHHCHPLQQHTGLPGRVLVGRAGGEDVHREPRGALPRQDDTPLLRPLLKVGNIHCTTAVQLGAMYK